MDKSIFRDHDVIAVAGPIVERQRIGRGLDLRSLSRLIRDDR